MTDLTPEQEQVFYYWIRGFTAKEVGQITNRSPRTIEMHFSTIRKKLFKKYRLHSFAFRKWYWSVEATDVRPIYKEDNNNEQPL